MKLRTRLRHHFPREVHERERESWRESRELRGWRAVGLGYFWLPCPVCREPFSGEEAGQRVTMAEELSVSHAVCRLCESELIDAARSIGLMCWGLSTARTLSLAGFNVSLDEVDAELAEWLGYRSSW